VAAFGVHNATPRVWTRDEITLIEETAERMWSAEERARAVAALREREQRLRLALEASAAGWWTRDAGANHVDWDEGVRRLYGFSPDEPASFDVWLGRVHEEDRPRVLEMLDDTRRPTRDAWDVTFRIQRSDGTIRGYRAWAVPSVILQARSPGSPGSNWTSPHGGSPRRRSGRGATRSTIANSGSC
jgi:PAS domain S-box-containing protein